MGSASSAELAPLLRKLESIATLSGAAREAVAALPMTVRVVEPRHDLARDKDRPSHCCVVLTGWACRYKLLDEGRRQILSFHVPGDIPDLQSLHLQVLDHSLGTVTQCRVGFLPHEALRELCVRFPDAASALWRDTLIDASIFREWMTGIGRRTAHGRIAHIICEMYLKLHAIGLAENDRCPWPVTQTDIGDALGLSNVHVNRVLGDLRAQGLIGPRERDLVIQDWDALRALGEFDATYLHMERKAAA
ncbi:Crp/Fnr family transcriptional regulator [Methylobacterium durans]|uniref:Crp/Fnr family transcriptional regulator n=1 Tax=Methylobacterium durans TaxID=2202825 RepID=UPI002AFE6182|nr:Crp/Fnr family transcriptional regulator [Methylobacterium durans]MEA1833397.1 Crp/Fnr family transcriptional regulator [Methylobacterium durans]